MERDFNPYRNIPPKPGGQTDKDSGISISSQRARSVAQASEASRRSRDSGISVSSQPQSQSRPSSKSVHWSNDRFFPVVDSTPGGPRVRYTIVPNDPHDTSSDTSSTEAPGSLKTNADDIGDVADDEDSDGSITRPVESKPVSLPFRPPPRAFKVAPKGSKEILPTRRIDGFCHAGDDAKDVTVQLSLELRDDPTEELEQLRLLVRLGRFHTAKTQFTKHLESYSHHPSIQAEYADMLWRQGDYKSLAHLVAQPLRDLKDGPLHSQDHAHLGAGLYGDVHLDAEEYQTLHRYWSAMRIYTLAVHDNARLTETNPTELVVVIQALTEVLQREDMAISSSEVRTLVLLIQLQRNHPSAFAEMGLDSFVNWVMPFVKWDGFFESLLRQRRIWDLHDLFCGFACTAGYDRALSRMLGLPIYSTGGTRLATKKLIAAFTSAVPEGDLSTNLALLSICTHIPRMAMSLQAGTVRPDAGYLDEFTSLAHSVLLHHPEALRSRPYLGWILNKAYHTNVQGRKSEAAFDAILSTLPGVFTHKEGLPMYIPHQDENPGWKILDSKPEFKDAVRMAHRTAREIGDYAVQVSALTDLIGISNDPANEFEELGTLLKLLGDNTGYGCLLISKYLLSSTPELRNMLKQDVAALISKPSRLRAMSSDVAWMVNMLYVSLEDSGSLLSRGPFHDARLLYRTRRLSTELAQCIGATYSFMEEDVRYRPVRLNGNYIPPWDDGTLASGQDPFTIKGPQASQYSAYGQKLNATDTNNDLKPPQYHLKTRKPGRDDVATDSKAPPDPNADTSRQQLDRLRQRMNKLQTPSPGCDIGAGKGKLPVSKREEPNRNSESEGKRAEPFSSRNAGNHPQGPPQTNSVYEEYSLPRPHSRMVSIPELNKAISQRRGIRTHPAQPQPPYGNQRSERLGTVPEDGRDDPSARGEPSPSEQVSPLASQAATGRTRTQEYQSHGGNNPAVIATDTPRSSQGTSERNDETNAPTTSDRPGKSSSDDEGKGHTQNVVTTASAREEVDSGVTDNNVGGFASMVSRKLPVRSRLPPVVEENTPNSSRTRSL